jgi:hypothetical protein
MIADDIRIEGFDARSWTNLLSLFAPPITDRPRTAPRTSDAPQLDRDDASDAMRGTLFVVVTPRGRVLTARHTRRGRVAGVVYTGAEALPSIARRYGASRVVVMREGSLEEIVSRASARFERHDDYLTQWITVLRAVRAAIEAGLVEVWPRPLASVPVPSAAVIARAVDAVLPDERSMVLGVFSGTTPWTLVALRRAGGEIDRVVGPDLIARWTGPLGGDYRRDHRVITEAVGLHLAPVHLGIYADVRDVQAILRDARPGAWAKAVLARDVIVQPTPPYVAVALAADGVRAAAQRTESVMELRALRDVVSRALPIASFVRSRTVEVASVTQLLGFDPLKLLAAWLERTDAERNAVPEASDDE